MVIGFAMARRSISSANRTCLPSSSACLAITRPNRRSTHVRVGDGLLITSAPGVVDRDQLQWLEPDLERAFVDPVGEVVAEPPPVGVVSDGRDLADESSSSTLVRSGRLLDANRIPDPVPPFRGVRGVRG